MPTTEIEGEKSDTPLTISGGSTTNTNKENADDRNANDEEEEQQQGTWEVEDAEAAREVLGGGVAADTDEDGSRSMLNMSRDTQPDMSNYNNDNLQSGEEGGEEEKEEKETISPPLPAGVENNTVVNIAVSDIVGNVSGDVVVGSDAVVDVVIDNVTIPTTARIVAADTLTRGAVTQVSASPPPSRPSNILQSHKVVLNHQPAIKKKGDTTNSRRNEEATRHSLTSTSMSSSATSNTDISQGKEKTRRPPFTPRRPPPPHRPYIVHEHHQLDGDDDGQPIDAVKRYDRALRGNKLPSLPTCSNSPRHHGRVVSSASRSIRGPAEVKFPLNPSATNCKSVQLAHVKRSGRAVNAELVVQSREPVVSVFTIRKPELTTVQIDQLNWGDEEEEGESGGRTNATMDVVSVRSSRRTSPHHNRSQQNGAAAAEQLVFLGQESTVTGTVLRAHNLPVTTSDVFDLVKKVDMLSPRSQFPTEEKRMYVAVPDRRHVEGRGCRQYPDHRTRYHSSTLFGGGVTMDDGSSVARISATPCTIMAVEHYDKEFMRKQLCGVTSDNKVYRPLSSANHPLSSTLSHSEGTLSVLGTSHMRAQDAGTTTNGMPPTSGRMRVDEDRRLLTSSHYASTQSRKYSLDNVINQAQLIRGELAGTARHTQLPECPSFLSMSTKRPIKVRQNQPTTATLDIIDDVTATLNPSKVTPAATSSYQQQQRQPKGPAEMYHDRQVQENMQLDRIYHQQATTVAPDDDESGPNASEDEARRAETARRRYDNHQMSLLAVALPSCL